jgi:4-hydroxy-tetrahydrodipicolinate synthase
MFRGVFTALVTPFKKNLEIDWRLYKKQLRLQIDAGVSGIIPCGTTGESPTLSIEEKKKLTQLALKEAKGSSTLVIMGTGSNDTASTISLSKWASSAGADGLLIVTPYYNKPSQAGLVKHFLSIADEVKCPIMLYNVPGRTGVCMTAGTVAQCADHENIVSIKEASGNLGLVSEILDLTYHLRAPRKKSFTVLSGDDALFLPTLSIGGEGIVSVYSNLFPNKLIEIEMAYRSGEVDKAAKIHQDCFPLMRDIFIESNPVPVKWIMTEMGIGTPYVRPPLSALNDSSLKTLRKTLSREF